MERVCRPGGQVAIIWPNHLDWLLDHGYRYVSFPGPMSVEFASYQEAVELTEIFYPKAAEEVRREEPTADRITKCKRELKLSNLDKVFFPQEGITKGDLIEYYRAIAPALVPHLRRPLIGRLGRGCLAVADRRAPKEIHL